MANKKSLVWADNFTAQRKMDIKKGDTVVVIAGKDKGKRGTVLEVRPRENRVVVENCNMVTKHKKPTKKAAVGSHQEGRYETPAPLDRSNVMLINASHVVDGKTQPAKISHRVENGKKVRVDRKTGDII